MFITLLVFISVIGSVRGFSSHKNKLTQKLVSKTQVYEDFKLDFQNPNIVSDKRIFSEKQLSEFTSTYSTDERFNILEFLGSLFKNKSKDSTVTAKSNVVGALKPTISVAVLEEKTALFVTGKVDAKSFYGTLSAAFGDNLSSVLPEILSNLPASKAKELSKFGK